MSFDDTDLYAGIAGAELSVDSFDLGQNITLSKTYAHLMAPFMMAFARAKPGKPHPGPLRAAKGGFGFDIIVQLYVPRDLSIHDSFDRINSVWWLVALLRFKASHSIIVPVVANAAFLSASQSEEEIHFWPMEIDPHRLQLAAKSSILLEDDLKWIRDHWQSGGKLIMENEPFNLLFQSCDQSLFVRNTSLALLMLWGALESLFSPSRSELRFRISANIASYLEPPGSDRLRLQKRVAKLYDARSTVAHGTPTAPKGSLEDTYGIVKRVIGKIIESDHVPSRDELEANLFGVND